MLVGCGSSAPVDLFAASTGGSGVAEHDNASAGMAVASAGAGQPAAGSGGGGSSAGGQNDLTSGGADVVSSDAGASAADSGGSASDLPCSPSLDGNGGMTGPFGTTGAACYRVSADIAGWGCSNFEGRTVKVNRVIVSCAELPLPDKVHGDYYFDVSPGAYPYASLYWF